MVRPQSLNSAGTLSAVRSLIFDLDGTLVESAPGIAGALSEAFHSIGKPLDPRNLVRRVRDIIGPPVVVMSRRLDLNLTDAEVASVERVFRRTYDTTGWRETLAFPGVPEALTELRNRGYAHYIITNKPLIPTTGILNNLGLSGFFTEVLTRDTPTPPFSSKTAMLADLLHRHHLPSESSLLIGDTLEDQEAAQANGVAFAHAAYGYGALTRTTRILATFPDLLQLFPTKI